MKNLILTLAVGFALVSRQNEYMEKKVKRYGFI